MVYYIVLQSHAFFFFLGGRGGKLQATEAMLNLRR